MAKQAGVIRLSGPLGDFSFYERDGKDYVRKKTLHAVGVDPRFDKTYLKGLDFGTASRASRLLRQALGPAVRPCCDDHIAQRLSGRFVSVVGADGAHVLGQRKVVTSNLHLLKGFEFNKHSAFEALNISATPVINRATGEVRLTVSTRSRKMANTGLVAAMTRVNFEEGTYASPDATTFTIGRKKSKELILSASAIDPRAVVVVTLGIPSAEPHQPGAMAIIGVLLASAVSPASNAVTRLGRRRVKSRAGCRRPEVVRKLLPARLKRPERLFHHHLVVDGFSNKHKVFVPSG